ncbi:hypothetical protein RHMOL_Rhmol06G0033500 [Rhododendron molle]|uniref:Uncharacterized protein n=1 Tax=Rhododendron molle TaxID=49168 RepID=A0ACC0NA92_RHOML|nr:hypothetical protein RHMOL_Rhmol06G0033500 [Rhododendron molle]
MHLLRNTSIKRPPPSELGNTVEFPPQPASKQTCKKDFTQAHAVQPEVPTAILLYGR